MILIASPASDLAAAWHRCLAAEFEVYQLDPHDRRALETCLKKVVFEALVIDMALLGEGGINEISALKECQPDIRIIVLTQEPDEREEMCAILFGAKAYCSHALAQTLLTKILKTVLSNELWVDRKFVTRLLTEIEDITKIKHAEANKLNQGVATMTPREGEIAALVATGASNRYIAEQLHISERTVKAHLGGIFKKMGITDRLQLALYMNRHQQLSFIWRSTKLRPH